MFCPGCGAENPDGARFCGTCGRTLPAPSGARPAPAAPERRPAPATLAAPARASYVPRHSWGPRLVALLVLVVADVVLALIVGHLGLVDSVVAPALPGGLRDLLVW